MNNTQMIALYLFFALILGLICIPLLKKRNFPNTEKVIVKLLVSNTILLLTILVFAYYGYSLKGKYTFLITCMTFISLTVIYFSLINNTIKKAMATIFILMPLLAVCILKLVFGQVLKEFDINGNSKIIVIPGGFLSCGELIYITQTKFGLFDKDVHYESSLCLREIEKIETVKIDDNHAEFLIYHNGKYNSENPYKYEVKRINGW